MLIIFFWLHLKSGNALATTPNSFYIQFIKNFLFRLTILALVATSTTDAATCSTGVHPACNSNFRAYNSTFYPNLLGQWTENEAQKSFSLFFPVRKSKCSDYLDLFLCSVLSPACVNDELSGTLPYDIPVPPCQSLCQIGKDFHAYKSQKCYFRTKIGHFRTKNDHFWSKLTILNSCENPKKSHDRMRIRN